MKGIVEERAIKLGEYIVESKDTVRRAAVKFGISKSTVHTDVTKWNARKPMFIPHIIAMWGIVFIVD